MRAERQRCRDGYLRAMLRQRLRVNAEKNQCGGKETVRRVEKECHSRVDTPNDWAQPANSIFVKENG